MVNPDPMTSEQQYEELAVRAALDEILRAAAEDEDADDDDDYDAF